MLSVFHHERGEELLAWPVLSAIVVTAMNDHVLKPHFPGFVTGKISDFAGLFFFPFLLTAVVGHVRWLAWATVLSGVLFVVIKIIGLEFGPVRIVADVTDLLALLSLPASYAYGRWRWPCEESRYRSCS